MVLCSFVLMSIIVSAGQLPVGCLQSVYKGEMSPSHHTTEKYGPHQELRVKRDDQAGHRQCGLGVLAKLS